MSATTSRKVAVIGGDGQLGVDVANSFNAHGDEVVRLTHADIESADLDSVSGCMRRLQPDIVVNTAAMHHVENCEKDPARAFAVNGLGARNIAAAAKENNAVLFHVSTDYVFDGELRRPYIESDAPCPLNVYGNTKLCGEYFVRTMWERSFVLRTSAIYGTSPCRAKGGLNFVELMLKLGRERGKVRVVDSEFVSPTPTAQLARQIVTLSASQAYGLYHATTEGSCSWFEFACEIFRTAGLTVDVQVAGPDEFPAKVPRPKYSVLENAGLKRLGLNRFSSWQQGLHEYLQASMATAGASRLASQHA